MVVKNDKWHETTHIKTCLNCGVICDGKYDFCSPKCEKAYRRNQEMLKRFKEEHETGKI
jgi:hypothetical protein